MSNILSKVQNRDWTIFDHAISTIGTENGPIWTLLPPGANLPESGHVTKALSSHLMETDNFDKKGLP
jgi:hypothetical protein